MASLKRFLKEARRRRVFRVAGIYIVAAWVAVQAFSEAFPALDIAPSAIRFVWLGGLVGLPLAIVFGWFYELTPDGVVRTAPAEDEEEGKLGLRTVDYVILAALAVTATMAIYQLGSQISAQGPADERRASAAVDPHSIAVLPLENLSGDPQQIYLVHGMHDELISRLSRISGLHVTSKTSTRAYAETDKSIGTICGELGVAKVIEGSVLRVEDDMRVNVQLIDCTTDKHLWAQIFDRDFSDVLIMQSEITRSIAREVGVTLTTNESEHVATARSVDPGAYELYLKGMFHLDRFTPADMKLAAQFFEGALEHDPQYALAHWGLGRACRFELQFGHGRPREREPECRAHLLAALQIDRDLPQVHLGLALGYWLYDYDWQAAEASFEQALRLNPNYAEAHMFYSHLLACLLRRDESDDHIRQAVELDPANIFVLGLHAGQQQITGRPDRAVAMLNRLHDEFPGFGFGFDVLWFSNFKLGNLEAAVEAAKGTFAVTMGIPEVVESIERNYATHGFEGAMLALGAELEEIVRQRYVSHVFIAMPFAMAGDADRATMWLEKAYEEHDPMMPYISTAPSLGRIANDPRYLDILERMNLRRPSYPASH